ncbi:GumC family protein [Acidisoma sp.]|uniref:GumC family protein n=1 Tax=Acidisoma sp. TaxID=1872115 RepID=UPI003AFFA2EA
MSGPLDPTAAVEPIAVPISRLLSTLRRHLWVLLLTVVVVVGATAFVLQGMPKQYTAQAALIIEPQRTQVSDLQAISSDTENDSTLMRTQIGILSSPALALGVVEALHLTTLPDFTPGGGLKATITEWLEKHHVIDAPDTAPLTEADRANIAAGILSNKLTFSNDPESRLLGIAVSTRSPVLSARIANEVARQYLAFKVQEKFAAMQRAHDWLQGQVASLAAQVKTDDAAVEAYRLSHGLGEELPDQAGNAGGTGQVQTVNRQQLDDISTQLISVSRDLTEKEGELDQAKVALTGATSTNDLPAVLASPMVAQLLDEATQASGRAAELANTEGPGNPELASARARAAELEARARGQMGNVARSLQVEVDAERVQQAALQHQMQQLRGAVSGENAAELGLSTLETQARATRNIYESFLSRAAQLANVAGIQEADASLVSSAEVPLGPSAPQPVRLLAIAGALSVVLGGVFAVLLERLRGGFSMPEQIESVVGLPLVGMLPRVRQTRIGRRRGGRAEIAMTASLDRLRGQMRVLGEARPRLLMVTSALPQEGKSVFSVELARNMAAAGWRVLLLECDFCCPSLAGYLGVPSGPGLCEILSGTALGATESLIRRPVSNLDVILAGKMRGDSQEMLASRRMSALLDDVRQRYDVVIMDTPPVLPVADALVLGRLADATIAVVHWEKTPRDAVMNTVRLLRNSGSSVMGLVMTRVDMRKASMGGGRMSYAFRHYDGYHAARA